jgi:hypothetical protein
MHAFPHPHEYLHHKSTKRSPHPIPISNTTKVSISQERERKREPSIMAIFGMQRQAMQQSQKTDAPTQPILTFILMHFALSSSSSLNFPIFNNAIYSNSKIGKKKNHFFFFSPYYMPNMPKYTYTHGKKGPPRLAPGTLSPCLPPLSCNSKNKQYKKDFISKTWTRQAPVLLKGGYSLQKRRKKAAVKQHKHILR